MSNISTLNNPTIQIYNFTGIDAVSAVACQFNVSTSAATVKLRITNLHGTNTVAFTLASQNVSSAPTVNTAGTSQTGSTATFAPETMVSTAGAALAAGDGIRVGPNSTVELSVTGSTKVWLIASAGATPVQVVGIIQNV